MAKAYGTHESLDRRHDVKMSSDRAFGFVFAVFFAIVGGIKLWSGDDLAWAALWFAMAAVVLLLALTIPRVLNPFNVLWSRFGLLLHSVVNPVIMALMFFMVITPVALAMRLLGKRPLSLNFDPQAETYWVDRVPPGPPPASMSNQF